MKLMIVAGEVSGDVHGSAILAELQRLQPDLEAIGIGGQRLLAQGLKPYFMLNSLQAHGMVELLRHLPRLIRTLWLMEKALTEERPDAILLIDYPGFNLKLAEHAKYLGIPVIFFNSPQVWAWRKARLKTIQQNVDLMLVLFPFETKIYEEIGVKVHWVGQPLLDEQIDLEELESFRNELRLTQDQLVLTYAPGSRPTEIQSHLPIMLKALPLIEEQFGSLRVLLPLADSINSVNLSHYIFGTTNKIIPLRQKFNLAVHACDLAVVASGTASLQIGLALKPCIVIYRVSPLSYWIARHLSEIKHIGMVNVLAGREIVPELIQNNFTPHHLAKEVIELLKDEEARVNIRLNLKKIRDLLGEPGAYQRTALIINDFIQKTPTF